MPGERFLSCGVFVVQKLPLSVCIKGVRTGLYCSISCCFAEVSNDSFDLNEQYWGAVSSTWVMSMELSSLSQVCEIVPVFDLSNLVLNRWQGLANTSLRLSHGEGGIEWNQIIFLRAEKPFGMLFGYGASWLSGMGAKPALLSLPEKLLFQVLVWRGSAPKGCP